MQLVHGNPHQHQLERTNAAPYVPGPNHGKSAGATGTGSTIVDPVDLSPEAQEIVNNAIYTAPGNSAHSTAHRAREMMMMAEYSHLADMPFGKVVSGLANGSLDLTPPAAVSSPGDPAEIPAPTGEGDGAEAPTDPSNPVIDDPTLAGDEPEPTEETVTEGTTAVIEEPLGETPTEADLVALLEPDEEILEIVDAALEETPLDEVT